MNKPHINILALIDDLNYGVGKKLICDVISGAYTEQIKRLKLNRNILFGSLPLYQKSDVMEILEILLGKGYIKVVRNNTYPVLVLTDIGRKELKKPQDYKSIKNTFKQHFKIEPVTDEDRIKFRNLGDSLKDLSDEQKKAVIHKSNNVLCVAGAGSGKTRVLTERIKFLCKYRNVDPSKVLAITFTRKAKEEMQSRLDLDVRIDTFNSYCEKYLVKHQDQVYGKEYKVMDISIQKNMLFESLKIIGISPAAILNMYFKRRSDSNFIRFLFDVYSLQDYYRNNRIPWQMIKNQLHSGPKSDTGKIISRMIEEIVRLKEENCYRDFTDQILHTIDHWKKSTDTIPVYDHVLVDEYQDVNDIQVEMLSMLKFKNIFKVGDPRQSIYGWRGANVDHILTDDGTVLQLAKNYRSSKEIVDLANKTITPMGMPDLKTNDRSTDKIMLLRHKDKTSEYEFVAESILSQDNEDVFVLARTNKEIDNFEEILVRKNIEYTKRTTSGIKGKAGIVISTIHAIKGMEADLVYILGANVGSFPCMTQDHPIMEFIKPNHDKISEELRVFYVAVTRARKKLVLNYTKSPTRFLRASRGELERLDLR